MAETFEEKTRRNFRVKSRYDELMRESKHGHYETMFRVVREEVERNLNNVVSDGVYYWARHSAGTRFVVKREGRYWYCCGLEKPMVGFNESQIICPVNSPDN